MGRFYKSFGVSFFFFHILFSLQLNAQPTPPEGMKWEEVPQLTDEFENWNTSKWHKSLWNYGEPVQMKAENSGVTDGKLWIKATLNREATRWFETSRVMSKTQISYPMYTECSMRTAHISAYNTFWMNNGNAENRDEFDICENNSNASITSQTEERKYKMYSQYFVVNDGDTERAHGNFDNRNLSENNPLKGVAWNEAYHTLGVWWKDENNIQFYLDGEPAGRVQSTRDFTRKLSIIWDLWTIDATWSGGIANKDDLLNDSINTMFVDWIHTYSLVKDESTGSFQEGAAEDIRIYPNPVDNILNIELVNEINSDSSIQIYDNHGRLIKNENLSNRYNLISLSGLDSGLYFVKVLGANLKHSQSIVVN